MTLAHDGAVWTSYLPQVRVLIKLQWVNFLLFCLVLGEMCEENAEWIAESAECKNGRCQCEDGYNEGQHQNCVSKNKG